MSLAVKKETETEFSFRKRRPISQIYLPSSYISSGLSYGPIFSRSVFTPTSVPKAHNVKYLTLDPTTCVHLPAACRHLNVIVGHDILYTTVSVDGSLSEFIGALRQIITKPEHGRSVQRIHANSTRARCDNNPPIQPDDLDFLSKTVSPMLAPKHRKWFESYESLHRIDRNRILVQLLLKFAVKFAVNVEDFGYDMPYQPSSHLTDREMEIKPSRLQSLSIRSNSDTISVPTIPSLMALGPTRTLDIEIPRCSMFRDSQMNLRRVFSLILMDFTASLVDMSTWIQACDPLASFAFKRQRPCHPVDNTMSRSQRVTACSRVMPLRCALTASTSASMTVTRR